MHHNNGLKNLKEHSFSSEIDHEATECQLPYGITGEHPSQSSWYSTYQPWKDERVRLYTETIHLSTDSQPSKQ